MKKSLFRGFSHQNNAQRFRLHINWTFPLKTTDIVGLDVRLGIAEYLHSTLGERFAPPQILKDKVARGELGRKAGKGFFDWPS